MGKIYVLLFLSIALSSCCNCDKVVPSQRKTDAIEIERIIKQGLSARESPVAFKLVLSDSVFFNNKPKSVLQSSFFNFKMEACDCWYATRMQDPITKIQIFRITDGKIGTIDLNNEFVGFINSLETGRFPGSSYASIARLIIELHNFNIGFADFSLEFFHTSDAKLPNSQFLVKLEFADGKKVDLKTPIYFATAP